MRATMVLLGCLVLLGCGHRWSPQNPLMTLEQRNKDVAACNRHVQNGIMDGETVDARPSRRQAMIDCMDTKSWDYVKRRHAKPLARSQPGNASGIRYVREDGSAGNRDQLEQDFARCRMTAVSTTTGLVGLQPALDRRTIMRDCMRISGWVEVPGSR